MMPRMQKKKKKKRKEKRKKGASKFNLNFYNLK